MSLARITTPGGTIEVEIDRRGFVSRAGGPLAWMAQGLTWAELRDYCSRKGWPLALADESEQQPFTSRTTS